MEKKLAINTINITIMVFGLIFMFIPNTDEILFLGIGFFVSSVLNLLFNNS
jgi:hypothetical protein